MPSDFSFQPSKWIPFRDMKEVERVRNIPIEDLDKHWNPDFKINIVPGADIRWHFLGDIVARAQESDTQDKKVVMIMPNPCLGYKHAAILINRMKIDCRNVHLFAMDEWANEDGKIAPESWEAGFGHALLKHFYSNIDPELRMPRENITLFTDANVNDYSKLLEDAGEADICFSGPGWAGHIAFVDPDVDSWSKDLTEWKKQGARVCNLHPLTIAQNSLHGCFGMSGDLTAVPPKAATIGPRDVIASKKHMDFHSLTTMGTFSSWQRMVSRLCLHGPVTPQVPTSILQELKADIYMSEMSAQPIEPYWDKEY